MRLAVCSLHSPEIAKLAAWTAPAVRAYCRRWGYGCCVEERKGFSAWGKARAVIDLMDAGYEGVLWIDTDALITNPTIPLESLAELGDLVLAADVFGINTGVWFARNTDLVRRLLYAVDAVGPSLFAHHPWREQEAFRYFLTAPPYQGLETIVPQRVLNAYLNQLYGRPEWPDVQWQPGDFILHLPGAGNETRLHVLRQLAPQLEQIYEYPSSE